jgi:hypothetical protein
MRHARLASTLSMRLLALAMIPPACIRGLVSPACCPQLLLPHSLPTGLAAIALAAVTTRTDTKKSVASGIKAPAHAKTFFASIGFHCFRHSSLQYAITRMIGRMIRAFGATVTDATKQANVDRTT